MWTIIAWLADGPHQVTQFRVHSGVAWWAPHILEAVFLLSGIPVTIYLIREGIRQRRIFTFDLMWCIASVSMIWGDESPNIFAPVWLPSSNFVNLNSMCGHMPFVSNPDCGRAADPILWGAAIEFFFFLALALALRPVIRRVRERRPGISNGSLFGLVFLAGLIVEIILEPLFAIPLKLWSFAPMAGTFNIGGGTYPWIEAPGVALWFAIPISLWLFKDDRGHTWVERNLEHHPRPLRTAITFLATYTVFQFCVWVPGDMMLMTDGFFQHAWPKTPSYILNDVCNAPGVEGTRYGPCPGSPGWRMPTRHSLPGESP
jgi:hypothetical protein